MEEYQYLAKKRKLSENTNAINSSGDYIENGYNDIQHNHYRGHTAGRHFIHLQHQDCETIFHTEDWSPSGSTLFSPLTEDLMINTRNIEQFTCSHGNFFVAGQDGLYSKTIFGEVLHLWRFCPQKRKLFISRSFLFKNVEDFHLVQQILQQL